jgi:hypothetical protein
LEISQGFNYKTAGLSEKEVKKVQEGRRRE